MIIKNRLCEWFVCIESLQPTIDGSAACVKPFDEFGLGDVVFVRFAANSLCVGHVPSTESSATCSS